MSLYQTAARATATELRRVGDEDDEGEVGEPRDPDGAMDVGEKHAERDVDETQGETRVAAERVGGLPDTVQRCCLARVA